MSVYIKTTQFLAESCNFTMPDNPLYSNGYWYYQLPNDMKVIDANSLVTRIKTGGWSASIVSGDTIIKEHDEDLA